MQELLFSLCYFRGDAMGGHHHSHNRTTFWGEKRKRMCCADVYFGTMTWILKQMPKRNIILPCPSLPSSSNVGLAMFESVLYNLILLLSSLHWSWIQFTPLDYLYRFYLPMMIIAFPVIFSYNDTMYSSCMYIFSTFSTLPIMHCVM